MLETFSDWSVKEMAVQNVWQHHFLQPRALSDVGETVAHMGPLVVEIAAL